jgi:hypothetical protein
MIKLAVVIFLRDNEEYIDFLNTFFSKYEKSHPNIEISYYAYENNSKDGTRSKMSEFMADRKGVFLYDDDEPVSAHNMIGVSPTRLQRMVRVRNKFLNHIRAELLRANYVFFLDTDIILSDDDLDTLLQTASTYTDIAMLTCNTKSLYPVTSEMRAKGDIPAGRELMTLEHYYDTYAFVNTDNVSYYPMCCFPECRDLLCMNNEKKLAKVPEILDVRSAWGGCVLVDAQIFNDKEIRWETISYEKIAICEHVYFCDAIRLRTGRRVVVLTKVSPFCIMNV